MSCHHQMAGKMLLHGTSIRCHGDYYKYCYELKIAHMHMKKESWTPFHTWHVTIKWHIKCCAMRHL